MYKSVYDLSEDELLELKYAYYDQFCEEIEDNDTYRFPEEIPDAVVIAHYKEVAFTDDDFFCNGADAEGG